MAEKVSQLSGLLDEIEDLLRHGLNIKANNLLYNLLPSYPDDIRLLQLYSLSLARLGVAPAAKKYIEKAYALNDNDKETLGILGRVYKDLFKKTHDMNYAVKSRDIYFDGYTRSGEYYPGINTATMSVVLGRMADATAITDEIIESLEHRANTYWELTTLGEAFLLQGNRNMAVKYYQAALAVSENRIGDINSSYHQLVFLNTYLPVPDELMELFAPPVIAAFSGHMIDRADRGQPRFPKEIVPSIKEKMQEIIAEEGIQIGYCSAACGADLLFIESMLERGGEVNVVLPFNAEDFKKTSVEFAGPEWVERFNTLLEKTHISYLTEESFFGGDDIYSFLGKVIIGESILRGNVLLTEPILLTVLNPTSENKAGGTANLDKIWPAKGRRINIDPSQYLDDVTTQAISAMLGTTQPHLERSSPDGMIHSIKCILFADIVGYSKLHEEQTPYFMYDVLYAISEQMENLPQQPEILNTWGDALFAVFDTASDLMQMALVLKNLFLNTDWKDKNLPEHLNIRIAVHAGPVFTGDDPIRKVRNGYGSHINRTARIEPVTLPGCIYASAQFAALLNLETGEQYNYQYVGQLKLPKESGYQEVYHIFE